MHVAAAAAVNVGPSTVPITKGTNEDGLGYAIYICPFHVKVLTVKDWVTANETLSTVISPPPPVAVTVPC